MIITAYTFRRMPFAFGAQRLHKWHKITDLIRIMVARQFECYFKLNFDATRFSFICQIACLVLVTYITSTTFPASFKTTWRHMQLSHQIAEAEKNPHSFKRYLHKTEKIISFCGNRLSVCQQLLCIKYSIGINYSREIRLDSLDFWLNSRKYAHKRITVVK